MALTFTPQDNLGSSPLPFTLPATDGKTYTSSELLVPGRPTLIMFICNHCPYVKAIEERLIRTSKELQALGVSVIGVCSNDSEEYPEDNFENLKKRSAEMNFPFTYLHDAHQTMAKAYGAVCTPDFFLYDSNHKLAYRGRLDDSWKDASKVTKQELLQAAKLLVQNKPIDFRPTPSMGCNIKWK
jgi:peroxiredoxin